MYRSFLFYKYLTMKFYPDFDRLLEGDFSLSADFFFIILKKKVICRCKGSFQVSLLL